MRKLLSAAPFLLIALACNCAFSAPAISHSDVSLGSEARISVEKLGKICRAVVTNSRDKERIKKIYYSRLVDDRCFAKLENYVAVNFVSLFEFQSLIGFIYETDRMRFAPYISGLDSDLISGRVISISKKGKEGYQLFLYNERDKRYSEMLVEWKLGGYSIISVEESFE